jgi:hypothetical protein
LVEWTASYGSATEEAPRHLGAPNWTTSSADVFFAEPPAQVQTKSGGATRRVLTGIGDADPDKLMPLLRSDEQRRSVSRAHAKWDNGDTPHRQKWVELANRFDK